MRSTACHTPDKAIARTFLSAYSEDARAVVKRLTSYPKRRIAVHRDPWQKNKPDQAAVLASASRISLYRFRIVTSEMLATSDTSLWVTFWLHSSDAA